MALSDQISELAQVVGTDTKRILESVGNLEELTTTQKASLVVALNELKATIDSVAGSVGATINDSATNTSQTWSSSKISSAISDAVTALVDGAPEAMNTLKELSDAIQNNKDVIETLQTIAAGHVKFDEAQSLTTEQQQQARSNIGAASQADLSAVQGTANTNATSIGTLGSLETTSKTNLVSAINEVKGLVDAAQSTATSASQKATQVESDLSAFKTAVGNTDADFAGAYTSARDGV